MSWDVLIFNRSGTPPSFDDTPEDWAPDPMGDAASVRDRLIASFPETDFSDPKWGIYDGEGFSIEFSVQEETVVNAIMLHVRGGGDPVTAIARLCRRNDWVAFDTSLGELLDLANPSEAGWVGFQQFRDAALE